VASAFLTEHQRSSEVGFGIKWENGTLIGGAIRSPLAVFESQIFLQLDQLAVQVVQFSALDCYGGAFCFHLRLTFFSRGSRISTVFCIGRTNPCFTLRRPTAT
jgi:hypothetical protein